MPSFCRDIDEAIKEMDREDKIKMSTKSKGGDVIVSPFTVLIDNREQLPYQFKGLKADARQGNKPIQVLTDHGTLRHGDYSIVGESHRLGIERKSKEDLYSSVSRRENFTNRLDWMDFIWRSHQNRAYYAIVVEAELNEIINDPPSHSKLNPKSLNRTIIAWRQRYCVDWYFLPNRALAEAFTYRILERFYIDQNKLSEVPEPV